MSVPGRHAYVEAAAALRSGRHVMVFSDGVDLDAEVALKHEAAARGRLVMGPDCGTVILGGVGLGFANVVVPGPVGIVAASGTGAQQVCGLLDGAGIGVRHVIGVGGRDLSAAVGGRSALAALAALDADPDVEVIVLVSKPPAPEVAATVSEAAAACVTPVVMALVGPGRPTLTDAAAEVAAALGSTCRRARGLAGAAAPAGVHGPLLGLFSGGTNCVEALAVVEERLGPVCSNVHHDPDRRIPPDAPPTGAHVLLDLGDDELTAGRPHPMIDPAAVAERLRAAADDGPGRRGPARRRPRARRPPRSRRRAGPGRRRRHRGRGGRGRRPDRHGRRSPGPRPPGHRAGRGRRLGPPQHRPGRRPRGPPHRRDAP